MNKILKVEKNIVLVSGDIFESNMQTLVNTVNCKGVMGAGIAKQFKKEYPGMFEDYVGKCKKGDIQIGKLDLWKGKKWILNFPTKKHWKKPSKLEWIEEGLKYFVNVYKEWGITSIAFPALGCNLGGLTWIEVFPLMKKYLSQIDIPCEIYEPPLFKIENIIDFIKNSDSGDFKNYFNSIEIVRSLYPEIDGWTDWRKTYFLKILFIGNEKLTDEILEKFKANIKENFENKVSIEIKKEEKYLNNNNYLMSIKLEE